MDRSQDKKLILTFNAYIDIFGNLTIRKEISKKRDIYTVLKYALEGKPFECVIVFKNKKRVERLLESLSEFV